MISNNNNKKIIVCIPAFNEAKTIAPIVTKALEVANQVIVYDDGSVDKTSELAEAAGAMVIRNSINQGYGMAIKSLFDISKIQGADIMITMDSDGQHDPSQISTLIRPILEEDVQIVIGSRFLNASDRDRVPRYRSIGIRTITRLTQVASYGSLTDAQSGFRAYSKTALEAINLVQDGMAVSTEIILRAKEKGLIAKEVPITIRYDVADTSSQNPLSHGIGVLYSVMQFISLRHPLAFYGLPGIVLLVVAALYMNNAMELFSASRYISTNMILVSVGTAVIGVVLFATGVILYTLTALLKGRIKEI